MSRYAERRRARPALGTFVSITAVGAPQRLDAAIDAAFAAVDRVEVAMSVHDPGSELSRLNAAASSAPVRVSRPLHEVLNLARRVWSASGGAFDAAVGGTLGRRRILPAHASRCGLASFKDVRFLSGRRVRFRRPLALDLGGIAKGYAVDRAVAALRAAGVSSGVVDAGGDVRVFGQRARLVGVRHPSRPGAIAAAVRLRDGAICTTARTFVPYQQRKMGPVVAPRTGRAWRSSASVSVVAPTAGVADALTKVAALRPDAARVLKKFRASAIVLGDDRA